MIDYTFLKNKIIRINIPDTFNSGYYCVNGTGLFRYVRGRRYDEFTDFSEPNDYTETKAAYDPEQQDLLEEDGDEIMLPFTVQREADITVYVKYEEEERADFEYAVPVVKIIADDQVITLHKGSKNIFKETVHLPTGRYYLYIAELDGRAYEYSVSSSGGK